MSTIDVWHVSPTLDGNGDYEIYYDYENVKQHVADLLDDWIPTHSGDNITIEVKHAQEAAQ